MPAAPAGNDSDSTTSTLHDLIAGDTTQLALHRAWQYRASLYLFLARSSTEGSDTAEKGGLSLLPCQLPNEVGAVAVGWARVVDAQVINADGSEGIRGSSRSRRGEGVKVRWRLTVELDDESWWLPCVLNNECSDTSPSRGGSGWTSTRAVQHLLHPNTASSSVENLFPSKPTSILQSIPCPTCHRATPRLRWSCHHCQACDTLIPARTPSLPAGDVDFGSSPLPTIGPRMDNGRAAWDSEAVRRKLSTLLGDGGKEAVKCAEYSWLSSPTPVDGAASAPSLVHLLSSGAWTKTSKGALSWLLSSAMPYERTNGGNTFQLGLLLADSDSCKKQAACCNAKEAGPLLHPLDMPDLTLAQRLLDLVDSIEQRSSASLCALGTREPRVAHRALLTVAGCTGAKHRLELPGAEATYLHLGGPATLAATTATPDVARKATKTILNAMVANGDMLCVPATKAKKRKEKKGKKAQKSSEEAAAESSAAPAPAPPAPAVTITIEAKSLCIGLLLLAD
ncbi:hypothetical protein BDZ90DRAFT_3026 [Jaminaea rosea]|uniref:Uncharacterized protein n=1 Tax=Jaminaea rosea TaxID=1569628 RepID=A0A316UXI0_9BASI|nr:hypothetical protein BDZ90DRAFT_3026 [Jaminaea rosea]PWN30027.1 hypothetical protein BDZ90DRAFT_3026 [Jaminaea rosea]